MGRLKGRLNKMLITGLSLQQLPLRPDKSRTQIINLRLILQTFLA
jgi:hypothetical protein